MLKKELKGDVQGVRRDLKKLSELGEELAEKENMLEERINIGNSNKANHQVRAASQTSDRRGPHVCDASVRASLPYVLIGGSGAAGYGPQPPEDAAQDAAALATEGVRERLGRLLS